MRCLLPGLLLSAVGLIHAQVSQVYYQPAWPAHQLVQNTRTNVRGASAAPVSSLSQFTRQDLADLNERLIAGAKGRQLTFATVKAQCIQDMTGLRNPFREIFYFLVVLPSIAWIAPFFSMGQLDLQRALWECFDTDVVRILSGNKDVARAELSGAYAGNFYLADKLATEETPATLVALGMLDNLTPGEKYTVSIYEAGQLDDTCSDLGVKLHTLGSDTFAGTQEGDAWFTVEQSDVTLTSILGRSIVVEPSAGGPRACAVVARPVRVL